MKCLNLYAVYGDGGRVKNPKGQALVHYPVFEDEAKKQYINLNGKYVPLPAKDFIRTEPANLGN